jgi:archaemetzincin
MRVSLLRIGTVEGQTIEGIYESLRTALPEVEFEIIPESLEVPEEAFDSERRQYHSPTILEGIRHFASKKASDRVLGIVNVDIFISELSYVFGEAEHPGRAALISLWRLRPEFYGKPENHDMLINRAVKEAVHELGHTLGLSHCLNPFCAMYFSSSIFETDRKQGMFCSKCYSQAEASLNDRGDAD